MPTLRHIKIQRTVSISGRINDKCIYPSFDFFLRRAYIIPVFISALFTVLVLPNTLKGKVLRFFKRSFAVNSKAAVYISTLSFVRIIVYRNIIKPRFWNIYSPFSVTLLAGQNRPAVSSSVSVKYLYIRTAGCILVRINNYFLLWMFRSGICDQIF